MPEIRVIEPIIFAPAEKLRVCAYARVSSDSTDQRNSFASQVNYYTKYIQAHEGWTFVDIYADQGITGTSALKRDEFLRLMRDCRQGKIDRILVKSVSRFARNAQDCIEAVRELRQLGVTVYFEKEHINTANMSNEMFLSMMSAFAQEESISISKNMRKGAVMRMKNGTFRLSQAPYGYYLDEKGILIVQQEESKIVQRIFGNFLSGMGIQEIAAELQKEHIPKLNGEPIWSYTGRAGVFIFKIVPVVAVNVCCHNYFKAVKRFCQFQADLVYLFRCCTATRLKRLHILIEKHAVCFAVLMLGIHKHFKC